MQNYRLGDYIRQRRQELNLTQEQVCAGICEPVTLSRFENGRQTDIHAIPAHMARGRLSSDIASIELDTIKVSLIYHFVRDEVILNSENKFLKVRW